MRQVIVYSNGIAAGLLTETDEGRYIFQYDSSYLADSSRKAISLSLPKRSEPYEAEYLFPFFYNMLSEGSNKALQCMTQKIDENDVFGLLLATAGHDTVGAVTIKKI